MEEHMVNCPLRPKDCRYASVGCEFKVLYMNISVIMNREHYGVTGSM